MSGLEINRFFYVKYFSIYSVYIKYSIYICRQFKTKNNGRNNYLSTSTLQHSSNNQNFNT